MTGEVYHMLQSNRFLRVSKELQKAISWIVHHELKDPRLKILPTILEVQTSRDFNYSNIYISLLNINNKLSPKDVVSILQKSSSYIRFLLAKKVCLRIVPILRFIYDDSFNKGMYISYLIDKSLKNKKRKFSELG
ncbi:MAG: 30S ribosome-binding factor RbfA [Buchnera aphidicola (Meitanaphis elongallis)]